MGSDCLPSSDSPFLKEAKLFWPFQNLKNSLNMPEHVFSELHSTFHISKLLIFGDLPTFPF